MNVLGVFAKHWTPGEVKTRLAAVVGSETAANLHRLFVERTLARFTHLADRRMLAFWPPEREEAFAPFQGWGWRLAPQSPGDLGRRMQSFFDQMFRDGAQRVVLIGSDSPTLPPEHVQEAFEQLSGGNSAVLGPTPDGGYYLVGFTNRTLPIFEGVAWSTPEVWRQTVSRLEASGAPFAVLPEWYDVDDENDLRRLDQELSQLVTLDPAWRPLTDAVRNTLKSTS